MTDFRLESELFHVLEQSSAQVFKRLIRARAAVISHPQVGATIPDLVVIAIKRPIAVTTPVTHFEASLIAAVMGRPATTCADFARDLYAPLPAIDRTVRQLVRRRLLIQIAADGLEPRYALNTASLPLAAEVVAIEAKLSRWREALTQATDYLRFANRSYIAMPSNLVRTNAKLLEACAKVGVGAIAVDARCAEVVLAAPRQSVFTAEWLQLVSRQAPAATARLRTRETPVPNLLDGAALSGS